MKKLIFSILLVLPIALHAQEKQISKKIPLLSNLAPPLEIFEREVIVQTEKYAVEKIDGTYWMRFSENTGFDLNSIWNLLDEELQLCEQEHFRLEKTDTSTIRSNLIHHHFQQFHNNLPIEGGGVVFHEKNGRLVSANGKIISQFSGQIPNLTPENAIITATKNYGDALFMWESEEAEADLRLESGNENATYYPVPELIYATKDRVKYQLVYKVSLSVAEPFDAQEVYVDASNGEIIKVISNVHACFNPGPGQGETMYNGTQNISSKYSNAKGGYILKNSAKNIYTRDIRGGKIFQGKFEFIDEDDIWTRELFLRTIQITNLSDFWMTADGSSGPDIYLYLKDGNGEIVYKTGIKKDLPIPISSSQEDYTFQIYSPLIQDSYTIEIWDSDFFFNQLLGTYTFTPSANQGSQTFMTSNSNVSGIMTSMLQANPALDIHWGLEKTQDFYSDFLGRNSFDGKGGMAKAYVNVSDLVEPANLPNAATTIHNPNPLLNINYMYFGLGDSCIFDPLVELDVVAHEFTHLVTFHTSNLLGQGESGALNESFSDILATAIEYYTSQNEPNFNSWDWLIAAQSAKLTVNGVRSFSNPHDGYNYQGGSVCDGAYYNVQPKYYKEGGFWVLTNQPIDNGGIHFNSGVQNHWFYLLVEGGTGLNGQTVTGIAMEDAIEIVYENLTGGHLSEDSQYIDAACGSISACINLGFSYGSQELASVIDAWKAVGLFSNSPNNTPNCVSANYTTPTGNFGDGSGTSNYGDNLDCEWLIAPPSASSITVSFSSFETVASEDVVYIYDGSDQSAPLIFQHSGNNLPSANITSSGSSLLVRFVSNGSGNAQGWELSYTSTGQPACNGFQLLTTPAGTVSDGSGTSNYGNNLDCQWLIAPPGATNITLNFSAFDTEVNNDLVSVYDGSNSSAPLISSFSGNTIPASITSSTGRLFIEFQSNQANTALGWQASYTSTGSGFCPGQTVLTALDGTFSDGSLSANYYNNTDCEWLIQPPGASSISLSFLDFGLELPDLGGQVIYDAVEVYDGASTSSPLLGVFSGTTLPPILVSSSGSMLVRFYSDNATTSQGWTATYQSNTGEYCAGTTVLTNVSSSFADGSGDNTYSEFADCRWLIQPPNATSILLDLTFLSTESGADGVIVYDGQSILDPVLGTFSGNSLPGTISSTSGVMLVRFVSNDSINQQGFSASYTANIGTGELHAISSYEYWFDQDYANRTQVSIPPVETLELNTQIPTSNLPPGLHTLNIRFYDYGGVNEEPSWSPALSQYFHKLPPSSFEDRSIVQYEYWFDNDYAHKVSEDISSQQEFTLNTSIDVAALPQGLHIYNVRFKDDAGQWSSVISQYFHKLAPDNGFPNLITGYRYWFDQADAALVNVKLPVPISPYELLTDIDATALDTGFHTVNIQFEDTLGYWSSVLTDTFTKVLEVFPVASFGVSGTQYCANAPIIFTNSSLNANAYVWDFGDGSNSAEMSPTHAYTAPGIYSIMLIASDSNSGRSDTILMDNYLHVMDQPHLIPIAGDTICLGDTIILSTSGADTYSWFPVNGLNTDLGNTVAASPSTSTTYLIAGTNQCGVDSISVHITVDDLQLNLDITEPICNLPNGTASASIDGGIPPYSYNWNTGATTPIINDLDAGNYQLWVTDANGCKDSAAFVLTQPDSLLVELDISEISCYGANDGSIQAVANGGTGMFSYEWSNGSTSPSISGLAAGTYFITITDENSCQSVDSISLIEPESLGVQLGSDTVSCDSLVINTGTTGLAYVWSTGDTTVSLNINASGLFSVTATDAFNCSETDTISVTIVSSPNAAFNFQIDHATASFQAMDTIHATDYLWDFGDGNMSVIPNPVHTYGDTGSYSITLITQNNHCTPDTLTQQISITGTVGIASFELKDQISIFPNPADEFVYIEVYDKLKQHPLTLSLQNTLGQIVRREKSYLPDSNNHLELPVSTLSSGMYFLRIHGENYQYVYKLYVVH